MSDIYDTVEQGTILVHRSTQAVQHRDVVPARHWNPMCAPRAAPTRNVAQHGVANKHAGIGAAENAIMFHNNSDTCEFCGQLDDQFRGFSGTIHFLSKEAADSVAFGLLPSCCVSQFAVASWLA